MNKVSWTTFRGKKVSLDEIDHQHLSNCYWYSLLISKRSANEVIFILQEMKERFNGQILPYRPHVDFEMELDYLRENGLLREDNKIYLKDRVIGEVSNPLDIVV